MAEKIEMFFKSHCFSAVELIFMPKGTNESKIHHLLIEPFSQRNLKNKYGLFNVKKTFVK